MRDFRNLGFVFKRCFQYAHSKEAYDHRIKLVACRYEDFISLSDHIVEHFCDRFYNYNNRIALPEQYEST